MCLSQVTLDFLTDELQLSQSEVPTLICRAPAVLGLDPKRTIQPKIDFLVDRVGLEPKAVKKVTCRV